MSTTLGLVAGGRPPHPQRDLCAGFSAGTAQSVGMGPYLLVRGRGCRPGAAPLRGPMRLLSASSGVQRWSPPKEEGLSLLPLRSRAAPRRLLRLFRSSSGLTTRAREPHAAGFGLQTAAGTSGFRR
ncbi:hypothetical protein NDU88_004095 [Pleurodeles waltl]|uniref:Uncharacterized protein n=1 Tax=Pleurodeles waltl TaxID=8319 RepID=A0AAV7T8R0_PLEWA|nr:hypothetical protein NDU88_004095 [Pleurodeles waltl]